MLSKRVFLIILATIVLGVGGCGKERSEKTEKLDDENALEEYASTLLGSLDKAKKTQIKASLHTIRLRINQFRQERGRYPDSLEELAMPDLPLQLLHYNPETGEVSLEQ